MKPNISSKIRGHNKIKFPFIKTGDLRVELGCGDQKHWAQGKFDIRIDINDYGQDLVWDVENGIPLPDDSCTYVYASQFLEHLDDIVGVMNEIWRVLKPNCNLDVYVPNFESEKALLISHTRTFSKYSFDFFQYADYANEYGSSLWNVTSLDVTGDGNIHVIMQPKK